MSNFAYYSVWLIAALVAIAFISAAIARHLHRREVRRERAVALLDALALYSDWVVQQRRATFFHGDSAGTGSPLEQALAIKAGWFPELAGEMIDVFVAHNRLVDFLWTQQLQQLKDPEAWLESDHDTGFMQLWRQHRHAVRALADKVKLASGDAAELERDPGARFLA